MSDALFLRLISDHEEIRSLLDDIRDEAARGPGERDTAFCLESFHTLNALLLAHARAEEDALYACFEDMLSPRLRPLRERSLEGFQEHGVIERLAQTLAKSPRIDDVWLAQFKVMSELLTHHLTEEEETFFPAARQALKGRELDLLADTYDDRHERWLVKELSQLSRAPRGGRVNPRHRLESRT